MIASLLKQRMVFRDAAKRYYLNALMQLLVLKRPYLCAISSELQRYYASHKTYDCELIAAAYELKNGLPLKRHSRRILDNN